jgi:ribosomal protein L16 Arg81 hydroxylase
MKTNGNEMRKRLEIVELEAGSISDPEILRRRLKLTGGKPRGPIPQWKSDPEFDSLLAPFAPQAFLEKYWNRNFYHFKTIEPARFQEYFSSDQLRDMLATRALPPESLYLSDRKGQAAGGPGTVTSDPLAIMRHVFKDSASLLVIQLPYYSPSVSRLSMGLERCLGIGTNVNCYLTASGGNRAFPWHCDYHHVLILQLEGAKKWSLFDTQVASPIESQKISSWPARFTRNKAKLRSEVILRRGEALYVPHGMPHTTATLPDQHSLHLTIGFKPLTWIGLFRELLHQRLLDLEQDAAFREPVFLSGQDISGAALQKDFAKRARKLTRELGRGLKGIDLAALEPQLGMDVASVKSAWEALSSPTALRETTCVRRSGLHFRVREDPDFAVIFRAGKKYCFDRRFLTSLKFMARRTTFTIGELPGSISLQEKTGLIRELTALGFLALG